MPKTTRGLFSAWRDRMKKLLLIFSICCINGFAYAGSCTPILCDESSYDVSEMLTEDGITGGPNNNDDHRFSSKMCYMCDTGGSNSQCDYGDTVVIARPGGQGAAFQCVDDAGPDDSWQQIPESALCTCGDSPLSQMDGYIENAMLSEIRAGQCNRGSFSNVIYQTGLQLSVCRYRGCVKGYKSLNGNMCVPETSGQPAQPPSNNSVCHSSFGTTIDVGSAYIRKVTLQECKESKAHILDQKGLEFEMVCRAGPTLVCKATKCPNGYTPNGDTGKCDPTDNNNDNNNNGGGGGTGSNSCEQRLCNGLSGSKYNECVACCHVSSSVANWNGSACICAQNPDSNKFVPNSNPRSGGECVPQQSGGTPPPVEPEPPLEPEYECDPTKIAQINAWAIQYASNTTISGKILEIIQYCEGKPTENIFLYMYNQLVALIDQENAAAQLTQQQNASRRRIEGAISDIESIVSTLDRSKWKNAEGGFNTSRLLSDSIAGVVLGTAGGLITSHVVKKNQVEGGFEDIQCTVGGQVVSGWGDEFQVGIQ